jgi:LuxR family transcriptional regulator, maltose regulon positive regulatory protein
MMIPFGIIKTKLLPPGIKDSMLRRAKLFQKFRKIEEYPVTLIYSGAGYGKSTALSLYIHDVKSEACWYSISSRDDDFLPFFVYVIHSIQTKHPQFGHALLDEISKGSQFFREEEIRMLGTLFINEMLSIEEEVTLVLDDFHHVEKSVVIEEFMENILEHCPPNFHLVISSRSRPRWRGLTRLKVRGQLLEINQFDLTLLKDEVELLLLDTYEVSLSEEEIDAVCKLIEGWVIALGFIGQQLQVEKNVSKLIKNRTRSLEDLFQYIALEVLLKQSPMVQKFLEQTSILEEVSIDSCSYILDLDGADSVLEGLSDKNIFIQSIGEGIYRYHALFKELLENRFLDTQPQEYRQLNDRAARYFERKDMTEASLYHLEKSGRWTAVAEILQDYGFQLLREGKLQTLHDRIKAIDHSVKDSFYLLWFFEAEVHRLQSKFEKAELCYELAIHHSQKREDWKTASLAYEGMAKIYLDTIQPGMAERYLQLAIESRENNDAFSNEDKASLYLLMAENLINSGYASKAEKWLERGRNLELILDDGNLLARLNLRTGRLKEAKSILFDRKKENPFFEENHIPQYHRETDLLLSLICAFMGEGEESKRYAQEAIQQGIQLNSPYIEACGWIRMGHAVQMVTSYQSQLAIQCYETSLQIMDDLHNARGKAEPYMGLCIYYAGNEDFEKAWEYGKLALHETERVHDMWLSSYIKLGISIAAIYSNRLEEAIVYLDETENLFSECEDLYGLTVSSLWKSYCAYVQSDWNLFEKECLKLLQRVQFGQYDFIFKARTLFGPVDIQQMIPLLLEAQKRHIQEPYISRLLLELGQSDVELHPGFTLRIQTLGTFKVFLGNREVKEKDWQRGKARELFELFITYKKEFFQKQQILDLLWANQEEKSADRDFKVALNALNNALEPNRKARTQPFFIKRSGSGYGLNPNAGYILDAKNFEEWVIAGLEEKKPSQSKAYLEKGLRLYEGDYLPERRFEDWCINERERLLVIFLRGAEKMAQASIATKDLNSAIYWCEKILEKDRTWEEAYRLLMYSYYLKNNRPQSLKWYQKCCETLQEEMGVQPLEATKEMYKMIMEAVEIGALRD